MVNHQQMHYDRHRGWQPVKAKKIDVLEFIYDRQVISSHDLMEQFEYTYSSARCRLCQLRKEGFIQQVTTGRWCLTNRGYDKLDYRGVIKRKEDEKERIKRQAEGRVWFVDDGRIRTAKNVSEMLLTFDEAMRAVRKLKEEGLL